MEQFTVRKTFKYKLQPTAEQEGTLAFVLRRCRELYNAALEERREAWRVCAVSITVAGQSAQLPEIKQARPEYQDIYQTSRLRAPGFSHGGESRAAARRRYWTLERVFALLLA